MIHKYEEISVKVVRRSGSAALVEWIGYGGLRRATIPLSQIEIMNKDEGNVDKDTLEMGIPYGVPWEEVIGEIKITPQKIADTLRQRGIWTLEDAQKNPDTIIGALQAAYGLDMATLISGARKLNKEKYHE